MILFNNSSPPGQLHFGEYPLNANGVLVASNNYAWTADDYFNHVFATFLDLDWGNYIAVYGGSEI